MICNVVLNTKRFQADQVHRTGHTTERLPIVYRFQDWEYLTSLGILGSLQEWVLPDRGCLSKHNTETLNVGKCKKNTSHAAKWCQDVMPSFCLKRTDHITSKITCVWVATAKTMMIFCISLERTRWSKWSLSGDGCCSQWHASHTVTTGGISNPRALNLR